MAQIAGTTADAHRMAEQVAQMAQMTGAVETVQRYDRQVVQMSGSFASAERYAARALDWLPSRLRDRETTGLFKPLLESTKFGLPEGAVDALASCVEERLTGTETVTPERFAEIAETFARG